MTQDQARLTPLAKPRIAIMGEFSAGKSTLCNLLLRARPLPEKVTATRLPPVWMSKGPGNDHRVMMDGTTAPVIVDALNEMPFEGTRHVRLHFQAEILDHCDLIDFPGISDPNMDSEVWERVLVEADAVIWLTHATQAWRQSEAAVWDTVPEEVRNKSILLITRFDKLTNDSDRRRVVGRVEKETKGLFDTVFPISLTNAIRGFKDYDLWASSGAEDFSDHLVDLIGALSAERAASQASDGSETEQGTVERPTLVKKVGPSSPHKEAEADASAARVMPRRVKPASQGRRERPVGISA